MRPVPKKLCECGCGKPLSKNKYRYKNGHAPAGYRKHRESKRQMCACGCGRRNTRTEYTYLQGHRPVPSMKERMWSRTRETESGCWEYTGNRLPSGYGRIWDPKVGDNVYTHRVSWELHHGEISDGLFVLHTCDNPPCWNPDHLFLGTTADNMADASRKGRLFSPVKEHCVRGHPREPNTGTCKVCKKESHRLIAAAAAHLGITQPAYRASYGASRKAAFSVLADMPAAGD